MEPQKTDKKVRKEPARKAGPSAPGRDRDRAYQKIMFVALNACVMNNHLVYAQKCPVQLSVGDAVWAVNFDLLTGEEAWRLPGRITEVPHGKNRKGKQYMVEISVQPYGKGLWPASWIDYVDTDWLAGGNTGEGAGPCQPT